MVTKPVIGSQPWGDVLNQALDELDWLARNAQTVASFADNKAMTATLAADQAQFLANGAVTSANGKNTTWVRATTPPTPNVDGDVWIDTANGNAMKTYDGSTSTWNLVQFGSLAIGDGAVSGLKLASGSVTASKIANGTITDAQLMDAAVTNAKILGIDAAKLSGTLDAANRIAAGALTGAKLANDTITSTQIGPSAITSAEIAANAVTAGKVAANAITATEIAAGSIGASQIAAGAVVAGKIAAGAIAAGDISAGAITTVKLAAGAVTATEIAAGAVVAGKIFAGAVTATEIAAGAITTAKIATGAITAESGVIGSLDADKITTGSMHASRLTGNGMVLDSTTGSGIRVNHPAGSTQLEFQSVDLSTGLTTFYTVRGAVYCKRAVTAGYGLIGYDSADGQTMETDGYPVMTIRGWVSTSSSNILECQTNDNVARVIVPRRAGLVVTNGGQLPTTGTRGFMSLPVVGGVPTGVPDAIYFDGTGTVNNNGAIPMVWGNNNRLYAYTGGAWKSVLFA